MHKRIVTYLPKHAHTLEFQRKSAGGFSVHGAWCRRSCSIDSDISMGNSQWILLWYEVVLDTFILIQLLPFCGFAWYDKLCTNWTYSYDFISQHPLHQNLLSFWNSQTANEHIIKGNIRFYRFTDSLYLRIWTLLK